MPWPVCFRKLKEETHTKEAGEEEKRQKATTNGSVGQGSTGGRPVREWPRQGHALQAIEVRSARIVRLKKQTADAWPESKV